MQKILAFRFLLVFTVAILVTKNGCLGDSSKIHPDLSAVLDTEGKANVFVMFVKGVIPTLRSVTAVRFDDRGTRNKAIKEALVENADNSHGGVLQTLSARSGTGDDFLYYKRYWNGNKIFVKQASAEIVNQIAEDPEVKMIVKEPIARIPEVRKMDNEERSSTDNFGIDTKKDIHVPEAWAELGDIRGEGVIVGAIDSGARHTHECLRDNFVGVNYGWFDPYGNSSEPYDYNGHGTNVLSVAVGSHGIGIAPGAKWMVCPGCSHYCGGEFLLDCMQFFSCPTLPDGSNEDCSKAPHIINNSWVTDRGIDYFDEEILQWRAMGIIPVFAIGNKGPWCETTLTPGEKPFVIGVGGSNSHNQHWLQSSVGPAADGTIKPDLVAPGASSFVAFHNSDTDYGFQQGTSIAAPHVSGVIALLKARDLDLTYEQVYDLLTQNTEQTSLNQYYNYTFCQDSPWNVTPNNYFGYGRVDALKVIQAQTVGLTQK